MKRALFAFQDASASQGQSEKLIVPCGPRPPFSRLDYPQILLQTHFFFGDERHVPPDQAESNFRMVDEAMFQRLAPGATHIHRIFGELADTAEAASRYEADMRDFLLNP
jgi:hypothetical protein